MIELVHVLLTVIGYLGAQVADPGPICDGGACPEVPHRPVVAWTAPQSVHAGEVRLFARGERRPGQPGAGPEVLVVERAVVIVAPAPERLRDTLGRRTVVATTRARDTSAP